MASAGKRQRCRKRRGAGQPMEVDAQEKEGSVRSPDCIERLARKYMQKCTVESSTESESESRVEVMPNPLAGGLKKAKDSGGLQFLDPYDGDSEDASVHTDCGIKDAPRTNSASKAMPVEDADTSEDEESFPNPPNVTEIQAVSDSRAALELPILEKDLLPSPELPAATEAFTPAGLTPDRASPKGVKPSASADLPAIPADTALRPLLAAHCDGTMARQPIIKRKQGIPAPEGAREKLTRKKFRANLISGMNKHWTNCSEESFWQRFLLQSVPELNRLPQAWYECTALCSKL